MLGDNIRKYRKAKGLRLKELGKLVHYAENTVSQWERNLREPNLEALTKLSEVLEVPINALLYKTKRSGNTMEIAQMLVLSNNHIQESTAELLDEGCDALVVYDKPGYGWFIPIIQDDDYLEERKEDIPSDLYEVLLFAQTHGCQWLMFDRDVKPIEELPHFDW